MKPNFSELSGSILGTPATLIVSAVAAERGALPGADVGVGPVRAAANAARLIALQRPDRVILLGTCGRYGPGPSLGSVVCGHRCGWAEIGAAAGLAYVPLPPPLLTADPVRGLPTVDVLTTGGVTTDPEVARQLGADWQVEHMETWGVAYAAAEAGVPFSVLLGVTNDVGPDAHGQWKAHRAAAEAAVQAVARDLLAGWVTRAP